MMLLCCLHKSVATATLDADQASYRDHRGESVSYQQAAVWLSCQNIAGVSLVCRTALGASIILLNLNLVQALSLTIADNLFEHSGVRSIALQEGDSRDGVAVRRRRPSSRQRRNLFSPPKQIDQHRQAAQRVSECSRACWVEHTVNIPGERVGVPCDHFPQPNRSFDHGQGVSLEIPEFWKGLGKIFFSDTSSELGTLPIVDKSGREKTYAPVRSAAPLR